MILLCNVSNAVWWLWKVTYSCYTYFLQIIKYRLNELFSTDIYRYRYFDPSLTIIHFGRLCQSGCLKSWNIFCKIFLIQKKICLKKKSDRHTNLNKFLWASTRGVARISSRGGESGKIIMKRKIYNLGKDDG